MLYSNLIRHIFKILTIFFCIFWNIRLFFQPITSEVTTWPWWLVCASWKPDDWFGWSPINVCNFGAEWDTPKKLWSADFSAIHVASASPAERTRSCCRLSRNIWESSQSGRRRAPELRRETPFNFPRIEKFVLLRFSYHNKIVWVFSVGSFVDCIQFDSLYCFCIYDYFPYQIFSRSNATIIIQSAN